MTATPTTGRRPHVWPLAVVVIFAAASFLTGVNWGLPGRDADGFLFGDRRPWTGAEVMALAGPWSPAADRGSDRPQHPAGPTTAPVVLNATDADRAEIVRRYRLYSCQPDEMITFRSLSRMRPARLDLDPRLYQYGGLWIYPVGGLLRLAAACHLLVLRTDLAFYLDHPEPFARFYVVARLYSAAWGLAGVAVVYGLTLELTGRDRAWVAATAAATYAAMPVVVNAAHEAKPHLAGTALTLAAVWAAARYVRTGRGWATAGVLAGAAAGMILTGVAAWAVLPVMVLLRAERRSSRLVLSLAAAATVFAVTNPYLPINALFHRERLASNVGNYGNFYGPSLSPASVANAARLVVAGTSGAPALLAVVGAAMLARRRGTGWLLAAPAVVVAGQFVLLAAGKPAEYARFALTPDVAIGVLAAAAVAGLPLRPREARLAGGLLVAATALVGMRYDLNFLADSRPTSTRREAARTLAAVAPGGTLAVTADPAPYGLPPVNLFTWRLVLLPRGQQRIDGLTVRPTDTATAGLSSPISWADKPFLILPAGRKLGGP